MKGHRIDRREEGGSDMGNPKKRGRESWGVTCGKRVPGPRYVRRKGEMGKGCNSHWWWGGTREGGGRQTKAPCGDDKSKTPAKKKKNKKAGGANERMESMEATGNANLKSSRGGAFRGGRGRTCARKCAIGITMGGVTGGSLL